MGAPDRSCHVPTLQYNLILPGPFASVVGLFVFPNNDICVFKMRSGFVRSLVIYACDGILCELAKELGTVEK